jgi:hypothetical protein
MAQKSSRNLTDPVNLLPASCRQIILLRFSILWLTSCWESSQAKAKFTWKVFMIFILRPFAVDGPPFTSPVGNRLSINPTRWLDRKISFYILHARLPIFAGDQP